MMKSTFFGSALGLLLAFSIISYSQTFIHQQDPKPVKIQPPALEVAGQVPEVVSPATPSQPPAGTSPADSIGNSTTPSGNLPATKSDTGQAPQTYTATAYSLPGRTASGKVVSRGVIAADPTVLPIGTRVRVEAGSWSGEYEVADTGGAIKGRRIDIWTPTTREARQFGRRAVKLTVLQLGRKRGKPALVRSRRVNDSGPATAPTALPAGKQDK